MDSVDVAIVGVTGAVGEAMLEILEERNFPVGNIYGLASEKSAGKRVGFKGSQIKVENLADFDFRKVQVGLFSAGGDISATYASIAAAKGCIVIDNTSHFRRDPEIPLIVPEVNAHRVLDYQSTNIIANPNCSTIQMLVALKPIYDAVGISRIEVSTYQAVSGGGKKAVEELASQTASILNAQPVVKKVHPRQIAFNVLPQIGDFEDNGYTLEEMKMVWETAKILEDDEIQVNPTCVRVPVFYGHSEAVHIRTKAKITAGEARQLLSQAPGVEVIDMPQGEPSLAYPVPAEDSAGKDAVFVGRIREDIFDGFGLNMWIVADNVRKGAALNSIQIAEVLIKSL